MWRCLVCMVVGSMVCGAGCKSPQHMETVADPDPGQCRVLGLTIMARNPTGLMMQEVKPTTPNSNGIYTPNHAGDIYRCEYAKGKQNWTAYIGSNPGATNNQKFEATILPGSEPMLQINIGWMFLYGRYPAGQSGHVKAGATGTAMLIQKENQAGGGGVRVFLLGKNWYKDTVEVYWRGAKKATLKKVGEYVEFDTSGNMTGGTIDQDQTYRLLVDQIMNKLSNIGYQN